MMNFIESEWEKFLENLQRTVESAGEDRSDLKSSFHEQFEKYKQERGTPETYPELLRYIAEGTELAISFRDSAESHS